MSTTKIALLVAEAVSVVNAERNMGSPDLVVRVKVAERLITTETAAESGEFIQSLNTEVNKDSAPYKARNLRNLLELRDQHPEVFQELVNIQQAVNTVKSSIADAAMTEEMKSCSAVIDSMFDDFNKELEGNKNALEAANKLITIANQLADKKTTSTATTSTVVTHVTEPSTLIGKTNEMLKPEYCAAIGAIAGTAFTVYNKGRIDVNVVGAGVASVAAGYFGVKYLSENIDMVKGLNPWILKTASFILGAGMVGGFNKLADAFVPASVNVVVADTTASVIEAPVAELAAWY